MGNNVNIEGNIPIGGAGVVNKPMGGYESGEFKRLVNMEVLPGEFLALRPRAIAYGYSDRNPITYPTNWIGGIYDWSILKTTVSLRAINKDFNVLIPMTGSTSTVTHPNITTNSFVSCFVYNKRVYWISLARFSVAGVLSQQVMIHKSNADIRIGDSVPPNYSDYSHTVVANTAATVADLTYFVTSFIMKDRLWIFLGNGMIYFSKATDLTVWATPTGGFFSLQPQIITGAVFIKDTIYVSTQQGINVLTYSIDPNTDSTLTMLSSSFNPNSLVTYQDKVLFIVSDTLYSIQSGYIQKLRTLNIDGQYPGSDINNDSPYYMYVWNSYVIISCCPRFLTNEMYYPYAYGNGYTLDVRYQDPTGFYFLNMNTNCLWEFSFIDKLEYAGDPNKTPGSAGDFFLNPYTKKMMFLTNHTNTSSVFGFAYAFNDSNTAIDFDAHDYVYSPVTGSPGTTVSMQTVNINVEIDSYVPDGTESKVKKFRSLVLEGRLPEIAHTDGPAISFSFSDSSTFTTPIPLIDTQANRPPASYRFPINQRARAITLRIFGKVKYGLNPNPPDGNYNGPLIAINRLSVFWSYLQRLPVSRNQHVDV